MAAKNPVSQAKVVLLTRRLIAKVDGTHTCQIYGSPSELNLEHYGGLVPTPESEGRMKKAHVSGSCAAKVPRYQGYDASMFASRSSEEIGEQGDRFQ